MTPPQEGFPRCPLWIVDSRLYSLAAVVSLPFFVFLTGVFNEFTGSGRSFSEFSEVSMYPVLSVMRVIGRVRWFVDEPFLFRPRTLRSPPMHDLDDVIEMLNGDAEDVAQTVGFLEMRYRNKVSFWLKKRQKLTPNQLALKWSESVKKLVDLARARNVPDAWYGPRVQIDALEYALRQCALLVTESPSTTDIEALVAVGEIFLRHGFPWKKLSPNEIDQIDQTIAACVENFDEKQRIVWKTFVAGFPRTRSSLPFLRQLLVETQGLSLSEAEIQRSLADARDRIRGDLQNVLACLEVQQ